MTALLSSSELAFRLGRVLRRIEVSSLPWRLGRRTYQLEYHLEWSNHRNTITVTIINDSYLTRNGVHEYSEFD